jgi:23S rRNA pseudouridine1911/1915/1917 synthase
MERQTEILFAVPLLFIYSWLSLSFFELPPDGLLLLPSAFCIPAPECLCALLGFSLLFALNKKYAAFMSEKIAKGEGIKKEYLAVVHGKPEEEKGVYQDLLFKDSRQGKSFIVKRERKGVKKASLEYEVLGHKEGLSLVRVLLHTGRTHQIRVQFSGRKMPLAGDGKYGGKDNFNIALLSFRLTLDSGESWSILPEDEFPWNIFDITHL